MTVVDVVPASSWWLRGNLEETVTKNNLRSREEIVRQLRRDIGGIIVVDFIDMVLESGCDLLDCAGWWMPEPGPHEAPGSRR